MSILVTALTASSGGAADEPQRFQNQDFTCHSQNEVKPSAYSIILSAPNPGANG